MVPPITSQSMSKEFFCTCIWTVYTVSIHFYTVHIHLYMRGSQKIPGIVVQHCNGRTYDNAYLITFKVGSLRAHTHTQTLAPSILPSLAALVEGFFWTLPEFSHCIRFDVLHGCKTHPLEAHFQSREKPKVTQSEIQRVWWLGDDRNAFFGEKLLHNKWCVAQCIIVMQKPLSLPLVTQFPLNCIVQPLQNLHVEMTVNSLSRWYELMVQHTVDVKKCNEHHFFLGFDEVWFLLSGRQCCVPLWWLHLHLWVVSEHT